ncbi:MAG: flagellar basal body rod protein FlgC [Alphaproteobacteria bacterium CG_4_9_14_3_um_filter_47_13]|nr:MAG: flagellar basal body rod protein FlgC [Alphaproteobacteria bacterium CG_4_9_14_3_um_filter_47_13]
MTELFSAMSISAYGMRAQSDRVRVISENMANASTAAPTPEEDPYTRQFITFKNVLDRKTGLKTVQVDKIDQDYKKPFPIKYMPDHPGADENGYVKLPNVDPLIEAMDMQEAQRSYEANLGMVEQSRNMILQTIDILRR